MSAVLGEYFGFKTFVKSKSPDPITLDQTTELGM